MEATSPNTSRPLRKIRTFADDMKRVRPDAAESTEPTAIKKPTPKAKAVSALPAVKPIATPTPPVAIPTKQPVAIPTKASATPPAFHTLQRQVVGARAIPPKTSPDPIIQSEGSDYSDTTIIRDTVKRKTNILGAIATALGDFGRSVKKMWKRANKPLYVVPDTNRRKGVIQQATSQTGKTFTADYERLKERLRQRVQTTETEHTDDEPELIWTPQTEPGFPLLTAEATPAISNVTFEPKRSITSVQPGISAPPTITAPAPAPVIPAKPAIPPTPPTPPTPAAAIPEPAQPAQVVSAAPVRSTPTPPVPPEAPSPAGTTTPTTDETNISAESTAAPVAAPETQVTPTAEPMPATRTVTTRARTSRWSLSELSTNTLTLGIAAVLVVALVIGVGITTLTRVFFAGTAEPVITSVEIPTITNAPLITVPYSINSTESLSTTIATALAAETTAAEFVVVTTDGTPWQPSQIFAALNLTVGNSFQAAVDTVHFIRTGPGTYGMLFTFSNPTQVRGSLLGWETMMGTELDFMFSDATTQTFIDQTENGIDVRIAAGTGLTYGFPNPTTGLIAGSPAQFVTMITVLTR